MNETEKKLEHLRRRISNIENALDSLFEKMLHYDIDIDQEYLAEIAVIRRDFLSGRILLLEVKEKPE